MSRAYRYGDIEWFLSVDACGEASSEERRPDCEHTPRRWRHRASGRRAPIPLIALVTGDVVNVMLQSSRRVGSVTVTESRPGADPVDVDRRGRDLGDGGSEVARACLTWGDVLKERPAPVRAALPHGSIAGADRRRGKAAQRENEIRSERQAHDAIAREAFVGSGRHPGQASISAMRSRGSLMARPGPRGSGRCEDASWRPRTARPAARCRRRSPPPWLVRRRKRGRALRA